MPYLLNGQRLRVGRPFTHPDGRQFGGNWNLYTDSEKAGLGLIWKPDPEPFDPRFYTAPGTPKDVGEVKAYFTAEQKELAGNMLKFTDWYVIRKSETDTAIPSNVATYRAAVRTVCAAREAEIAAVTTTEELEVLMNASAQIRDTDGETFITNPAALTQWPEALS